MDAGPRGVERGVSRVAHRMAVCDDAEERGSGGARSGNVAFEYESRAETNVAFASLMCLLESRTNRRKYMVFGFLLALLLVVLRSHTASSTRTAISLLSSWHS